MHIDIVGTYLFAKISKNIDYHERPRKNILFNDMHFAIFGNQYQDFKASELHRVIDVLRAIGASFAIESDYAKYLFSQNLIAVSDFSTFSSNDFDADFAISMGGDGTFLTVANHVGDKQIPIIGINTGRLGFLADISPSSIETSLRLISQGEYDIEERTVISIEADGKPLSDSHCALNDIAILKRDNASMITISVEINGEPLTDYEADGLIVSTTTGSTAYSLSVGGPILVPQTGILAITPVAPHSLNVRPVVISDSSEITMRVESRTHQYLVAIDGRSVDCTEGTILTIKKAPYVIRTVKRRGQSFFKTLREKMMWGAKFTNT